MKAFVAGLLVVPATLAAQQRATVSHPVTMEISSVDSTRVSSVSIDVHGSLFESVGVLRPAFGQVQCGPSGCVATTPAVLELSIRPGEGKVSVSEDSPELAVTVIEAGAPNRRIVAFGHAVTFARDTAGQLVVSAPRMLTRF